MQRVKAIVIVPPRTLPTERFEASVDVMPVRTGWVRGALLAIALGLLGVFSIAAWLNPYDEEGNARRLETHLQIGLPPCTFRSLTGIPCPSCGMTTSFALLMHGDLANSLRANAVGTLLALFGLAVLPWSLASAVFGRPLLVRSPERAVLGIVIVFVVLLLTRWLVILTLGSY